MTLPNQYNLVFNFAYVLVVIMILYIPMFPFMYLHMFSQRKKYIGNYNEKKNT